MVVLRPVLRDRLLHRGAAAAAAEAAAAAATAAAAASAAGTAAKAEASRVKRAHEAAVQERDLTAAVSITTSSPSDFDHQHSALLANCSPIELQLLGELGSGKKNYSGDDPEVFPVSRYWRPKPEDIPLKEWAIKKLNTKA